jgi:hypothetical protein
LFTVPAGKGKLEKILKKIFELSAVPAGKGKLEKMSLWTSSVYMAPATAAKSKIFKEYFLKSPLPTGYG